MSVVSFKMYFSLYIFVQAQGNRLKGVFQTEDDRITQLRFYIELSLQMPSFQKENVFLTIRARSLYSMVKESSDMTKRVPT